ncbi:MAG: SurA N-terminal domain-containing protein [Streptosporangiaceae bacterium]|nr:SurA N-terminal domain-containing protein [Streptosporangiaceae bacterium]
MAVAAAAFGACALVSACAPVKMGAAAVVGSQRISIDALDSQVANLAAAYPPYASQVQITTAQMPGDVLSWLIRFAIRDQMAQDAGITVSQADVEQAIAQIDAQARAQAQQSGQGNYSLRLLLVANGIPPDMVSGLGRYQAIELAYIKKYNNGTIPTSTAGVNAATAQLNRGQCEAAKTLNIQVNPQFGRLDYSQYSVVPAPDTLSRAPGAAAKASPAATTPAC